MEADDSEERPHYLGHRERLRDRFEKAGAEGFHDYELLELLLTYAIPKKDLKPLAKNLLNRFGSLTGVLDATQKELDAVKGIGPFSATLIRLVKELSGASFAEKMAGKDLLSSPQAVVDYAKARLSGLPNETFMVIYLNTKNEVLYHESIQEGTIDRAFIYPRRIIEGALARHASSVILIHNHPSGHPEPSEEDKRLTRTIGEATRALDIRILDHLIVGMNNYFSFMENHLL
jgi:DNA repair protein RadC